MLSRTPPKKPQDPSPPTPKDPNPPTPKEEDLAKQPSARLGAVTRKINEIKELMREKSVSNLNLIKILEKNRSPFCLL